MNIIHTIKRKKVDIMTVNVAICDDDVAVLDSEADLLQKIFAEKHITYTLKKFLSPKSLLDEPVIYDLVFLDIEMDEINGIELARQIYERKENSSVFFITNYSVYLDKAFDVNAIRFLSKPVDPVRLGDGIDSALERLQSKMKTISVTRLKNKLEVSVEISSIIYLMNTGRHTQIVTTKNGEFEVDEIFSTVKDMIEKEVNCFCQPHQSFYVNLIYVTEYSKDSVVMTYAGKKYEANMTRRRYKAFDEKFFTLANKLR